MHIINEFWQLLVPVSPANQNKIQNMAVILGIHFTQQSHHFLTYISIGKFYFF